MARKKRTTAERKAAELFGSALKSLRLARGWEQKDVARALNVISDTVSKWERGEREPSIYNLISLADLFGAPMDRLLTGSSPRPPRIPLAPTKANDGESPQPVPAPEPNNTAH